MRFDAPRTPWRGLLGLLSAGVSVLGFCAAAGLLAGPATAYLKAGPTAMPGVHNVLRSSIENPLEGVTVPAAAYSFRKLRSAYAGSAAKLRRTTGGTQDIGFIAGGDFDSAAAATFCSATTCFIDTWYDQSGNARHAAQATVALQPAYVADCGTGRPCMTTATDGQLLATASFAPASPVSVSGVMERDATVAAYCFALGTNFGAGNAVYINPSSQQWVLGDGVTNIAPAASDGAWHAAEGVIDGAASVLRVDTVETTGTLTTDIVAGAVYVSRRANAGSTCRHAEAVLWSGYALLPAERAALADNQRTYWRF